MLHADKDSFRKGVPPEVSLVFPPLVTTNFGNYYPSTALLSGFLKANGFSTTQTDLNEEFALFLLRSQMLDRMSGGDFGGNLEMPEWTMPRVAARLLSHNRERLLDEQDRHDFSEKKPGPAHLLRRLAEAYRVDLDLDLMATPDFSDRAVIRSYRDFYADNGYGEGLPSTVHLVGISVPLGPQLVPALILARHIKKVRPDVRVVFGGPSLSLMNAEDLNRFLMLSDDVDGVVRFDGEFPLLKLAEQSRAGVWQPWQVSNVSCLRDGTVHHSPAGSGPRLDDLAYGDYDERLLGRLADPEIGIVQARGCYWGKCSYCDYIELYKGSPRYRTRTVDRFIAEMKHQIQIHQGNRFAIITESIPSSFARRMSMAILENGLDIRWSSFAMVDKHFTPELFRIMAESGCSYLEIGVESMTNRVLALVEKAATLEMNRLFLRSAADVGVNLKVNIIPDLPSTTYQEALASLKAFQSLEDCIASVGVYPFEPTRSSRIGRNPSHYMLQPTDSGHLGGQSQYPANHFDREDPAMTLAQRHEIHGRFFAFREMVNGRRSSAFDSNLVGPDEPSRTPLRLAQECLDFCPTENGLQCYHMLTRELFCLDRVWGLLLETVASRPFTRHELIAAFQDPEKGKRVYDQLVQYRLLLRREDQPNLPFDTPLTLSENPNRLQDSFSSIGSERLLPFQRLDEVSLKNLPSPCPTALPSIEGK